MHSVGAMEVKKKRREFVRSEFKRMISVKYAAPKIRSKRRRCCSGSATMLFC